MKTNTPSGMLAAMVAGKEGIREAVIGFERKDIPTVSRKGVTGKTLSDELHEEKSLISRLAESLAPQFENFAGQYVVPGKIEINQFGEIVRGV